MVFFYFCIPHIKIYVRVIIFWTTSYVPRRQSHLDCIIRIYISDYPGIFFSFSPCLKKVLWFDSLCPFLIILIFLIYLFLVRSTYSENPNFLVFFIFPSGPSASFANCQLTSVDSACLKTQFWFSACRRRRCLRRHRRRLRCCFCCSSCIRLAASTDAAIIHSAAAILVVRRCCSQPLSAVSVCRHCLCCRLHCYPRATAVVVRSCHPQPSSAVVVSRCCLSLSHHQRSPQCPTANFHNRRCVSASSAAFGISPKIGRSNF